LNRFLIDLDEISIKQTTYWKASCLSASSSSHAGDTLRALAKANYLKIENWANALLKDYITVAIRQRLAFLQAVGDKFNFALA